MSRVLTNNTSLRFTIESTPGVLPGSPQWRLTDFESPSEYGATITTTPRRPISQARGRKKGVPTDLDSTVAWPTDLTMDSLTDFLEGFTFSEFANVEFDLKSGTGTLPPPATATGYTIDSASALLAGKVQFNATGGITLVYAKGYLIAGNNGLKPLTADLAPAGTEITVAGLTIETPPTNASLQVAGMRGDDFNLTVDGGLATGSLASVDVDFTTIGLKVGQYIHVGSADANGAVQNAPQIAATTVFGYARITAIAAGTLTLDKLDENLGLGGAGSSGAGSADILFNRFARNVPVASDVDDERFLERSYQFEVAFPDLGGVGVDEYEYSIGNFANELVLESALNSLARLTFNFIGLNSDDVTPTRKTNAANAVVPLRDVGFSTAGSIKSLTTDLVSSASDVCFNTATDTIRNNASAEKCLGTLGARFINAGLFEVDIEGQMLFSDKNIVNAIKRNDTVTYAQIFKNEDGSFAIDVPEATASGGDREYPVDESVKANITLQSFTSKTFGFDVGVSLFVGTPWV